MGPKGRMNMLGEEENLEKHTTINIHHIGRGPGGGLEQVVLSEPICSRPPLPRLLQAHK